MNSAANDRDDSVPARHGSLHQADVTASAAADGQGPIERPPCTHSGRLPFQPWYGRGTNFRRNEPFGHGVIAAAGSPHRVRIVTYVPSSIIDLSAAWTASRIWLRFLETLMPSTRDSLFLK